MKQKLFIISVGLFISLLAGCASLTGHRGATVSANEYLQLAANAKGVQKQLYLLKAATRLTQDRQLNQAQRILNNVNDSMLTPSLQSQQQLLQTQLLILNHRNDAALTLLNRMTANNQQLTADQLIQFHQLLAQIYQNKGNIIANIKQHTLLIPLLKTTAAKKQNLLKIWQNLQSYSPQTLADLLNQTATPDLRGWLSLTLITENNSRNIAKLTQQLAKWRQQYPNHPADALLPGNLNAKQNKQTPLPRHITLLLPLQGKLSTYGNAIRNGFLAAYYYWKKSGEFLPTVRIVDSSKGSIVALYQQAVQQGANFIVGPLSKNNVAALAQLGSLPVPTLALNSLPNPQNNAIRHLYTFGLSPIDEAQQTAIKAWNDHHSHVLVIAPNNIWGQNIAAAFMQQWQSLGGTIIAQMYYTNQRSLSKNVEHLLNVDQAYQRERALRKIIQKKMRFIPRRRKDFDMIFIVGQPLYARQIRPLLKFYFAGNIPIYSISKIYQGIPNQRRDHDLNGIIFCDMPWVLTPKQMKPQALDTILQRIKTLWPTSYYRRPKLYALGVDAFDVIPNLNKMLMLPQFGTNAATGTLYLEKNQHIFRKLDWAQMTNGKPRLIAN